MADNAATLIAPALGAGRVGSARREAIRAFSEQYLELDGNMNSKLAWVEQGTAPQDFKDAFRETLEALVAAVAKGDVR